MASLSPSHRLACPRKSSSFLYSLADTLVVLSSGMVSSSLGVSSGVCVSGIEEGVSSSVLLVHGHSRSLSVVVGVRSDVNSAIERAVPFSSSVKTIFGVEELERRME